MNILRSSITRRDAKTYLSQFDQRNEGRNSTLKQFRGRGTGFARRNESERGEKTFSMSYNRYIARSMFIPISTSASIEPRRSQTFRIIIIKLIIRDISDKETLESIATALSHAMLLGIRSIIIVDYADDSMQLQGRKSFVDDQKMVAELLNEITRAISRQNTCESIIINDALTIRHMDQQNPILVRSKGQVYLERVNLIKYAAKDGKICIVAPLAFSPRSMRLRHVSADDALVAICRGLSSKTIDNSYQGSTKDLQARYEEDKQYSVDRVILIDPLGGIPNSRVTISADDFINLEEEYDDVMQDLKERVISNSSVVHFKRNIGSCKNGKHRPGDHNALILSRHIRNLELVRNMLYCLPSTSSALIASPTFISTVFSMSPEERKGTDNHRGSALVHNFLTNKPPLSLDRKIASQEGSTEELKEKTFEHIYHSSFIRRGNKLKILPQPIKHSWSFVPTASSRLKPLSSAVNLERVRDLLENSFGQSLDMGKYFGRIQHSLAGLVIAGDYSGCAILTWERGHKSHFVDSSSSKVADNAVPYLDKFAVAKHCQGENGLASTMFSAISNEIFGSGFVWRSRKNNIVNKWYFGRSIGTWKLPNSDWTMFWTTSDVECDISNWQRYVHVCTQTKSSWEI